MKNLGNYFYDSITESIYALGEKAAIEQYYGDPEICTIENYFAAQICGGKLYDHTEEFSEDTFLCDVEEYKEEFEYQRQKAYKNYLNSLED